MPPTGCCAIIRRNGWWKARRTIWRPYGSFTNISTAANPVLNPTNMPLPFGISHIPVLVNNQFVYTPAVQRVLQLAANIYDATTNNTSRLGC